MNAQIETTLPPPPVGMATSDEEEWPEIIFDSADDSILEAEFIG